jgi:uncharacterized protein YjgD (DUF1641 family)
MADSDIAEALEKILARLDTLESKVDAAGALQAEAAPTEVFIPSAVVPDVASRLKDPAVAHGINRLLDRLDRIETAVDAFGYLASKVHVAGDALAVSASYAFEQAEAHGVDPIAAGVVAAGLAAKAAQPEALSLIDKALDQTALAHKVLDSAPLAAKVLAHQETLEVLTDALSAVSADDLKALTTEGAATLPKLATLVRSPEFQKLTEALEATVSVASQASTALVETRANPVQPVGAFGAFFKISDPDVQRAIGFSLALAKAFGSKL